MQTKTSSRWRVVVTTLVSLAFLVALIVYQSTAAQEQPPPVTPLNPPFEFQVDHQAFIASGFPAVPPSATRLLTETFGSSFNPSLGVTGTTTMWRIFTDTGSVANYWARVIPLLSTTYADTAWAPCGPCDGSGLNPDSDDYPADMGTWLIYGPVDLKDYYGAEVLFHYLLDANPAMDGSGSNDYFGVGFSDDGTRFSGFQLTGDLTSIGWQTGTLSINVAGLANKSSVYVGFYFTSNNDANTGRGVFIDNVSLRAAPYILSYLPQVARNFAIATPTPTQTPYLYNYRWDSGAGEGDPDLIAWGGTYSHASGGTTIYEQGLGGGGMYLYGTQPFDIVMAGPNLTAPENFEISVDFDVFKDKNKARYGVIFGASTNTFNRSGGLPGFNTAGSYYRFGLQFPDSGSQDIPTYYRLERCEGDPYNCVNIVNRTGLPSGLADGNWDTVTIRRQGSSIVVLVNNTQLISVSDGTFTGAREFGMYIQSQESNSTTSPLEIDFDNYRVRQYP